MTLTTKEERDVWKLVADTIEKDNALALTKDDLRDAVVAAESWVVSNEVSYNSSLPEPFKTEATQEQKARALRYVLQIKYGS